MDGYVSWREASAAATKAYHAWNQATSGELPGAFYRYRLALDREERAADEYRRLVEMVRAA